MRGAAVDLSLALTLLPLILPLSGPAGAATLPPRPPQIIETALAPGESAALDRSIGAHELQHPGQSGLRLVSEGSEALAVLTRSAQLAERSLDVQTFIWHADLTGRLIGYRLLEAADRGVKIRILLDDVDGRHNNGHLAAAAAHPNIAVRVFNPFVSRRGILGFITEGAMRFERLNRRMHNKTWIVDNRIAVVGGRNLGDEYFSASTTTNFLDLDFAMIGPIVRAASASFDEYWNSPQAYPIELIDPAAVTAAALQSLRRELDAVTAIGSNRFRHIVSEGDAVDRLLSGERPMQWSKRVRFIADDPRKVTVTDRDLKYSQVRQALLPLVLSSTSDLMLLSPYFIPGESITASLTDAAKQGRRIRVLTNSLAANDIAAVHAGYARYRRALLEGRVQIWELKGRLRDKGSSHIVRSSQRRVSLHTKALLVDQKTVFVGSYNLDPRSAWLNCEQGVLVENEALAKTLADLFAHQISAGRAWHVEIEDGALRWSDGSQTFSKDPHASAWARFQVWLARVLRLEAQL